MSKPLNLILWVFQKEVMLVYGSWSIPHSSTSTWCKQWKETTGKLTTPYLDTTTLSTMYLILMIWKTISMIMWLQHYGESTWKTDCRISSPQTWISSEGKNVSTSSQTSSTTFKIRLREQSCSSYFKIPTPNLTPPPSIKRNEPLLIIPLIDHT